MASEKGGSDPSDREFSDTTQLIRLENDGKSGSCFPGLSRVGKSSNSSQHGQHLAHPTAFSLAPLAHSNERDVWRPHCLSYRESEQWLLKIFENDTVRLWMAEKLKDSALPCHKSFRKA
jgi:hypothetical protein